MNTSKLQWVALIAVAIIAIAALYVGLHKPTASFGGVTNYDELDATAIKIGGSSGSRVGPVIASTCNLLGADASVAASSSIPVDCAVTGVVSGDIVFMELATSTQNGNVLSWALISSRASTTAGFITGRLLNLSGAAAVPSATAVGSSTNFLVFHPRATVPGL